MADDAAPVYGDPLCLEEVFIDLEIRFAQRGLRWIKMAQSSGISATNRRFRGGQRSLVGYGRLKPKNPTPFLAPHEDFNREKSQYVETLPSIIEDRDGITPHDLDTRGSSSTPPNLPGSRQ